MSEVDGWKPANESGIRVVLTLGPDYEEAAFTMPTAPRIGEKVTLHDDHPETGSIRVRYYRVREVEWPLSDKSLWPPMVHVYCDALPSPASRHDSAGPATAQRDDLWETLGIDPDRISREEFNEYMDAYDQAASAGPVRPGEEPTA